MKIILPQNFQMAVRFIGDICYEQIKGDYWYASYLGVKVVMNKSNGYINATKLCADGGKHLFNWLQNKHSKGMLNFYQMKLNQSQSGEVSFPNNLTLEAATHGIPCDGNDWPNVNNAILPSFT